MAEVCVVQEAASEHEALWQLFRGILPYSNALFKRGIDNTVHEHFTGRVAVRKANLLIQTFLDETFSIATRSVMVPTQSPIQLVLGALTPEVKQQACEADYSPSSSAALRMIELYFHSPISLYGVIIN
jgi:hypothetical protein